jgi:general secretion pathway protein A
MTHELKAYYHSHSAELVYSQMKEKIREGRGILCLTGEAGVGKSFLLERITTELASEINFIFLPSRDQDFQGLITGLCEDLGLATGKEIILVALQSINKFLEKQKQTYPRIALVIDDAHQLQAGVLDKLLLLSVAPSKTSSSLQVILSGLPELEAKFYQGKRPRGEQSIFSCYKLETLEPSEVADFIKHDLSTGDYGNIDLFTPAAVSLIAECSNGIPRLIKIICDSALSAIGAPESPRITEKLIEYVAKDLLLVSAETANETSGAEVDQGNSLESKDADFVDSQDKLSLAKPDVYDNIGGIANQQLIKSSESSQVETGLKNQSDLPLTEFAEKAYLESKEDRLQSTMNFKTMQRLIWAMTGLAILGAAIFVYRSNTSSNDENPQIANQVEEFLDEEESLGDDTEQADLSDTALVTSPLVTGKRDQNTSTSLNASTGQPGSAARAYIADLEDSGGDIDLDVIFDQAELLNKQNQPVDNYLLNFYAAKRGHANAAFRLAQMADPATFSQGSKMLMFNKANVTQANKWYSQAALAGHPKAARYLKAMRARIITEAATGDEKAQRQALQFQDSKTLLPR